jgi:hypothetical protein
MDFTYRVFSATATRVRRALWLMIGGVVVAASVYCFVRLFSGPPVDSTVPSTQDRWVNLWGFGAWVGAPAGLIILSLWLYEDGVRGPGRLAQRRGHVVRPPWWISVGRRGHTYESEVD